MVVRGRLAFDDQGRLVEISETANDPNNPQPSEIDPVEFDELIAQTAAAQNLDATQLASSLDAAGYDLSNVGAFDSTSVSTEKERITSRVIRAYSKSGGSYEDYKINNYTDIGAAINQAIVDMGGSGRVVVPAGTFNLTTTVALDTATQVHGQGLSATTIKLADGANTDAFVWESTNGIENFAGLRDMYVGGNSGNNTSGRGFVVRENGGSALDAQLENVWINNFSGLGIEFENDNHGHRFRNVWVEGCNNGGAKLRGDQLHIDNCYIAGNSGGIGLDIANTSYTEVNNSVVLNTTGGAGLRVYDMTKSVVDIKAGLNGEEGVLMDSATSPNNTQKNAFKIIAWNNNQDAVGADDVQSTTYLYNNKIHVVQGDVDASNGVNNEYDLNSAANLTGFREQGGNTINGVGYQTDDPRNAGFWNGSGREGIEVWDTSKSHGNKYTYVDGAWRTGLAASGDFVGLGPSSPPLTHANFSTTSTSYVEDTTQFTFPVSWDGGWRPSGKTGSIYSQFRTSGSANVVDVRLRNVTDGETVFEVTGLKNDDIARIDNYTPTTTNDFVDIRMQVKSQDGTSVDLRWPRAVAGVQL